MPPRIPFSRRCFRPIPKGSTQVGQQIFPSPPPTPDEILRRVGALQKSAVVVRAQHTISQVIQRRFTQPCGPSGEDFLARFGFLYGKTEQGAPKKFGKIQDFVRYASSSMEEVWANTEKNLHGALDAVVNGTTLGDLMHEQTLREAVVMHYIRCPRRLTQHMTNLERQLQEYYTYMLNYRRQALKAAFYDRYGLYAMGSDALTALLDELTALVREHGQSGALFRVMLEDQFDRFSALMSSRIVEVCSPTAGEFLFGDHPAQAIRWNGSSASPVGEVGLRNADEIVLPVTPHHIIALRDRPGVTILDPGQVEEYNRVQIQAAEKFVHFRSGSPFESLVRRTRDVPEARPPRNGS